MEKCLTAGTEALKSEFTGGAIANAFVGLLVKIVGIITLGLAYPAMYCWRCRWQAGHTYIHGRRLSFDGKGHQLFGRFLLWVFLSVITLGIYFLTVGKLKITAWKTKHTHFEDVAATVAQGNEEGGNENKSQFTGKWYQLFGVNFLCNFVTIITLTLGFYWAHCYKERWYCKHKVIDGCKLYFDGKAGQYFGKLLLWGLLSVITLGIYLFWLKVKSLKWQISHTHIEGEKVGFVSAAEKVREDEGAIPVPVSNRNPFAVSGFVIALFGAVLLGIILATHFLGRTADASALIAMVFTDAGVLILGFVLSTIGRGEVAYCNGKGMGFAATGMALSLIGFGSLMAACIVLFPHIML